MNTATAPRAATFATATHELKIWPQYFESLASGERTAEIRPNDRNFRPGDTIYFREWDPKTGIYSGRFIARRVTFVFPGPFYARESVLAVPAAFAILSLARLPGPIPEGDSTTPGTKTERPPYDCLAKLAEGEPYFVLRGQDLLASDLVSEWASFAEVESCPIEKVNEAREIARRMEAWPNRKYPD